ncbi:hypothetical protein K0T92_02990 [Paenibacillus oenotherae]|uniref:Uncharacterized protein n=1 Tax=Paenibacillus oenotherae TaxID=1435645 RepID=A0ABS7D3F2_9BACL|nr:hypothetical protein [Paenibacillus oenotherae]MBW7473708.1 hypothetical protein [Paenibacillus oenotherae]
MDEIIAFLSNNIFLVVIIIGFIASLINKGKRKNATGMPDFSGRNAAPQADGLPHDRRQDYSQMPPVPELSSRSEGRAGSEEERHAHSEILTQAIAADRASAFRPGNLASTRNAADLTATREAEPFRMPEGEELRRAIVVAEILGPPRAKRPYRPNS